MEANWCAAWGFHTVIASDEHGEGMFKKQTTPPALRRIDHGRVGGLLAVEGILIGLLWWILRIGSIHWIRRVRQSTIHGALNGMIEVLTGCSGGGGGGRRVFEIHGANQIFTFLWATLHTNWIPDLEVLGILPARTEKQEWLLVIVSLDLLKLSGRTLRKRFAGSKQNKNHQKKSNKIPQKKEHLVLHI